MAIKAEICTLGNYLPWKLAITRWNRLRQRNMESNHIIYIYSYYLYSFIIHFIYLAPIYFSKYFSAIFYHKCLDYQKYKKKIKETNF